MWLLCLQFFQMDNDYSWYLHVNRQKDPERMLYKTLGENGPHAFPGHKYHKMQRLYNLLYIQAHNYGTCW